MLHLLVDENKFQNFVQTFKNDLEWTYGYNLESFNPFKDLAMHKQQLVSHLLLIINPETKKVYWKYPWQTYSIQTLYDDMQKYAKRIKKFEIELTDGFDFVVSNKQRKDFFMFFHEVGYTWATGESLLGNATDRFLKLLENIPYDIFNIEYTTKTIMIHSTLQHYFTNYFAKRMYEYKKLMRTYDKVEIEQFFYEKGYEAGYKKGYIDGRYFGMNEIKKYIEKEMEGKNENI